ncbi:MAG: HAMP domain-containing sensor histidine kinase [Acidimicrobiia bacterium]
MRLRLIIQAAAVTSMVALAFVIPLAVVISQSASDRALDIAERQAENIARYIAVLAPETVDTADLADLVPQTGPAYDVTVILPDGSVVGDEMLAGEDLSTAIEGTANRAEVANGIVLYLPVVATGGATSIVRVVVPQEELRKGVARSWLILAVLGVTLVGIAVAIADWIGRSVVRPVSQLSASAVKWGSGEFAARVEPDGPSEIRAMGVEFNRLADQIDRMLVSEREAAADLSHRLRTPLTALRLDVEALNSGPSRERVLDDLAEMERTVDYVIDQARRGARHGLPSARTDLAGVIKDRVEYWAVLAEEQSRTLSLNATQESAIVAMETEDASALIDALIENVFAHTPEGTPFAVTTVVRQEDVLLAVEDGGPGLPDHGVLERGRSEGSSSGLGLDIVRKTAEGAGGSLRLGSSGRMGGSLIAIRLPLLAD